MPSRRVLQHRQRMQRNVRPRPGVGRRGQVVGVGLAGHLEHGDRQALGHLGARGEPLAVGPGAQHRSRVGVARIGLFLHVVEIVEHQKGLLQPLGRRRAAVGVVQQVDHRLDVEPAQHGAQQLRRPHLVDQRTAVLALGDAGQIARLDPGRVVHARRHPAGQQLHQKIPLARRRISQQLNQLLRLLRRQRKRRNALRCALGDMGSVGFEHGLISTCKRD